MEFHHLGIATRNILEDAVLFSRLGYQKEREFRWEEKGIYGEHWRLGSHRVELLMDLYPGMGPLMSQLRSHSKVYHLAYRVESIFNAGTLLREKGYRQVEDPCPMPALKAEVAFFAMPAVPVAYVELIGPVTLVDPH